MADKLNSSLDDILKANPRSSTRRGRGPRRSGPGRRPEAPVGGVAKTTKQAKPNKALPTAPAAPSGGETKIMISNLVCHLYHSGLQHANTVQPFDVEENQLKVCKAFEGL